MLLVLSTKDSALLVFTAMNSSCSLAQSPAVPMADSETLSSVQVTQLSHPLRL